LGVESSRFTWFALLALALTGCQRQASTQSQGDKTRQRSQHTYVALPFCGANLLRLELPDAYEIHHDRRIDFDLFFVTKRGVPKEQAAMGLYVGRHPDSSHPEKATAEQSVISSIPVTWWSWDEPRNGKSVYHREVSIDGLFPIRPPVQTIAKLSLDEPPPPPSLPPPPPPPVCEEGSIVQAFALGFDRDEVLRMARIADSLQRTAER
jgi:hypothetical protein